MGLLAVVGGIAYGLLHLVWLRKFDSCPDDEESENAEKGEANEKDKFIEPTTKDQGTSMSLERLSLMIKYNQIGSLLSLPRGSRVSESPVKYISNIHFIPHNILSTSDNILFHFTNPK